MDFSRLLLLCLPWLAVLVLGAIDVAAAKARSPSCATRCGDIDVPYPFGMSELCAIHSRFTLDCMGNSNGYSRLFHAGLEVTKISVEDNKAWLKTYIAWQCYNVPTNMMRNNTEWNQNITETPYVLSANDNKIIVLGCGTLASMRSDSYIIGCLSTCDDISPQNGSCSGAGCCQADLPRGVRYYEGLFNEYNSSTSPKWRTAALNCSYVSVIESTAFTFSTTYLTSTAFYDKDNGRTPVVMEWAIAENTCKEAKINTTSYECVSNNTDCIMNDAGYACECSKGYTGNPYIIDGCTDLNECLDNFTYPCAGICKNTLGSYTCSCPRGEIVIGGVCMKDHRQKPIIWMVPVFGTSILLLAFCGPFIMRKIKQQRVKKMKQKFFNQNHGLLLQQFMSHNSDIGNRMIITLRELEKATDNFSRARVVGGGGHGVVFKGILDLQVVAIKKSKIVVQREIDEFINEVAVLSQVNHRNVVKLLGCCLETKVPLLVYEFISNGTLYNHLHIDGPVSLLWVDRIRIALEIARALSYIHSAASMPIFHRDIKSSNILLDDSLTAKVSDFGASRYIPIDQTGVTTVVQGTLGYLDPMYYYTGRLTDKSDVFSFGVLLVELLTRKQPFIYRSSDGDNLVSHFEKMLATSNLVDIVDPQVLKEEDGDLHEVAILAALCTKLRGEDRPTMMEVEMKLENMLIKKKLVSCITTPRTYEENEARDQYMSTGLETNDSSRHHTMEEEILLSARYPR